MKYHALYRHLLCLQVKYKYIFQTYYIEFYSKINEIIFFGIPVKQKKCPKFIKMSSRLIYLVYFLKVVVRK